MKLIRNLFIASFLAMVLSWGAASTQAADTNQTARTMVHLLDYIAQDYAGAVGDNGQVKDEGEYKEQQEFCESALSVSTNFFGGVIETEIQNQLHQLHELIASKAAPEAVAKQARAVKNKIIEVSKLPISPKSWPDLANGARLFNLTCAQCHGTTGKGDGPGALTLNPKPASFHDPERMDQLSPFQAYNTVSLGVPGTAMAAFNTAISDKELWDLAFYVVSLRHADAAKNFKGTVPTPPALEVIASSSDAQLKAQASGSEAEKELTLSAWRLHAGGGNAASIAVARDGLRAALAATEAGDYNTAKSKALAAYLEGVEPIEPRLKAANASAMTELEQLMADVRGAVSAHKPVAEIKAAVERAEAGLDKAAGLLTDKPLSPVLIFSVAAAIILREGFEAVLVIVAILGVLRAVDARKAASWVHGGWISALLLGFVCWLLSEKLVDISGMQRELMEGITSLVAVVILLSLGFWLHSKTEMTRWKEFIEVRIKTALSGGNLFGLAFIAFIAVFREALETVLFLAALSLEGGNASRNAMGAGVFGALALVIFLAWIMLNYSRRIPIRKLFTISAALMGLLAVILTGKGLHSLQETGIISITSLPSILRWDLVGIYPTLETVLLQVVILLVTVVLWRYGTKAVKQA